MNNLPLNHQNIDNIQTELDLHEQAGLRCIGYNEDGILEWDGSKYQWDKYEELYNEAQK